MGMTQEELLLLIDQAADEGWTELDLSGNNLTELPPEIGKLTQLETLILGRVEKWKWVEDKLIPTLVTNQLTTLPAELAALKNLKTLDLSGNSLVIVPHCVFQLPALASLIGVSIGLSEIPAAISTLTHLTKLSLSSNQISVIPEGIGNLTHLTELSLSSNQISVIPEVISTLTNLTTLDLSSNQISVIPEVISTLTNLTGLYLSSNQISVIPEVISTLTNLTTLDLSSNQISVIPECIGSLTNLTELYLNRNQISEIPECIGNLTNLTKLVLHSNRISEIPECIGSLTNLTELFLDSNQISVIPEVIGSLTNLTRLALFSNQISEIPECIGNLTNLTELYLNRHQISEIPECIGNLTHLTLLYLASSQISEIPECIGNLTNLTELYLFSNQISEIPECIGKLTNLRQLELASNQISEIPECIGNLTQLERLDLQNNKIKEFPDRLEALPKLTTLDLRGNPLPISPEVLGSPDLREAPGSISAIFNYVRQLRSGDVRPLNEAKLLLIGQGSVGKTSLINRLIHNTFNPNQPQTDGLNVQTWNIHVNSKDVRLNVWDFGGQEIYHATHQFFLTKRSLYLLVCNCRTSEDENRIEYWLKLIESFGGQSPVIIVGNKCDEQPLDINRKALREKYPNIQAILETSCASHTDNGIAELRQAITQEVSQLKEVYDLLPLSWFEVKEHLEALDKDFIKYEQYACICHDNTITHETDQEQLVSLLHNLGLVLNFRDHPILQSTNVLNPDWVTAGIYALLSDDSLKTHTKGVLTPADLSRILDPVRYPSHRHLYLIELMKEFQLCFELPYLQSPSPGEGSRVRSAVLIPGLLPKDEPANTELEGDTLDFQYHYRILPESILSRFIVLTHEKIHNQTYWRSGVMLAYTEGNQPSNIARIEADPEEKKIFISVSGRAATRRSVLLMIRDVFTRIHNSFAKPEISEWVPVPNHPDHPPLDYQELLGLEDMGEQEYPIGKLKLRVNLRQLLDGYEPIEVRQQRRVGDRDEDDFFRKGYEDMLDLNKRNASRPIINKAEANAMTDQSSKTTHFNAPVSTGAIGDGNTVSNNQFTQVNNASTAELLQLIASLRQTAAQFPKEIQDGIIIDIEDIETEVKKPEDQRNPGRLKKRLLALTAAVGMMATPVKEVTDFATKVVDLGKKVGIEIQLPKTPPAP
jgi:internalin A